MAYIQIYTTILVVRTSKPIVALSHFCCEKLYTMIFQGNSLKGWCSIFVISVFNLNLFCIVFLLVLYAYQSTDQSGFPLQVYINKGKYQNITNDILKKSFSELQLRGFQTYQVGSIERPDWCNHCFYRPYRFIINSSGVCRYTKRIDLLIVIFSSPQNKHQRNVIRGTWAKGMNENNKTRVRYIFLIGNSSYNDQIRTENKMFGDLILQNFEDSYHNLTLKTLMGFEWGRKFCPQAAKIMKTDDDVFIHIPRILLLIGNVTHTTDLVYGDCYNNNKPVRDEPIKEHLRKFYTPYWRYPHHIYPPFCRGIGYIISAKNVDGVLSISSNIPFFEWEDVYIGLCLKALGSKVESVKTFVLYIQPQNRSHCTNYRRNKWYITGFSKNLKPRKSWSKCILPMLKNKKQ